MRALIAPAVVDAPVAVHAVIARARNEDTQVAHDGGEPRIAIAIRNWRRCCCATRFSFPKACC